MQAIILILYLDQSLESKIVREQLATQTEFVNYIIRDDTGTRPFGEEGPRAAFSKYAEPHDLCFWIQWCDCPVCLYRGRDKIIPHLLWKVRAYQKLIQKERLWSQWMRHYHSPRFRFSIGVRLTVADPVPVLPLKPKIELYFWCSRFGFSTENYYNRNEQKQLQHRLEELLYQ